MTARRPTSKPRALVVVHGHRDGHAVGGEAEISAECVARVRRAERLVARRGITQVLFCGAGALGHLSEARQMAGIWRGPPVRMLLDERSTDTAENAAEALSWARTLDATELTVVSSWWHLRLRLYYAGRPFRGLNVRQARSWRWDSASGHLSHELRYLPRACRAYLAAAATATPRLAHTEALDSFAYSLRGGENTSRMRQGPPTARPPCGTSGGT